VAECRCGFEDGSPKEPSAGSRVNAVVLGVANWRSAPMGGIRVQRYLSSEVRLSPAEDILDGGTAGPRFGDAVGLGNNTGGAPLLDGLLSLRLGPSRGGGQCATPPGPKLGVEIGVLKAYRSGVIGPSRGKWRVSGIGEPGVGFSTCISKPAILSEAQVDPTFSPISRDSFEAYMSELDPLEYGVTSFFVWVPRELVEFGDGGWRIACCEVAGLGFCPRKLESDPFSDMRLGLLSTPLCVPVLGDEVGSSADTFDLGRAELEGFEVRFPRADGLEIAGDH